MQITSHQRKTTINITDRVVMRAATVVVIAAGRSFKRAAAPSKAITTILIETAAGGCLGARMEAVTEASPEKEMMDPGWED